MKKYIDDYELVIQEDSKGREKKVAVYKRGLLRIQFR